jgi:hypothetical protein
VGHLQDNGFEVIVDKKKGTKVQNDKLDLKVPAALWSCHTAFIGDYVIEGHVPAKDIKNMLENELPIRGLSVPGMKLGPPGMEGTKPLSFTVYQFNKYGKYKVHKRH